MDFGIDNPFGNLKRVLVHRPGEELNYITAKLAKRYLYTRKLNLALAQKEHDVFVDILKGEGIDVLYLSDFITDYSSLLAPPLPNIYFTRDLGVILKSGAIVNRMFYDVRKPEISVFETFLKKANIPIKYIVKKGATEGGNMFLLPNHGLMIGCCERTTLSGVSELVHSGLFNTVELVKWKDTWDDYHLDVELCLLPNHVVAYEPTFDADYLKYLEKRYGSIIPITEAEKLNLAANMIPLTKNKVLGCGGLQLYKQLENYGFDVIQVEGNELFGARGGPRCITLEILRE